MSPGVCELHGIYRHSELVELVDPTSNWAWCGVFIDNVAMQAQTKGHIGYTIFIGAAFFVIILFYIGLWVYYSINGCAFCREMHPLVLFCSVSTAAHSSLLGTG